MSIFVDGSALLTQWPRRGADALLRALSLREFCVQRNVDRLTGLAVAPFGVVLDAVLKVFNRLFRKID